MKKYFIGISALHHDSAVALIDHNGNIICVSQEERRTGIKNDSAWPHKSYAWMLQHAERNDIEINDHNTDIAYYEHPWLKFTRRMRQNPKGLKRYFNEARIPKQTNGNLKYIKHHDAHAIAGCATAPFDDGIYLTVDAVGEFNTTTWGTFSHETGIKQGGAINYPNSLGVLYSAFTRWLGFKPNEDEYIVMGAAAYGKPNYEAFIWKNFIELTDNGFKIKTSIHRGIEKHMSQMCPVNQWCDWAASIQAVTEKTMLHMVNILVKKYGHKNLVLGGGVALNCVANSKIISSGLIRDLWILPSPGDSGNAIGAAAAVGGLHKLNWQGPFLGASVDPEEPSIHIIREVTNRLEKGEIIGWIQGREEFGPRSLGHRSLLADPRRPEMKDRINQIKHRQGFRPFAPSVLEEHAFSYFDMPGRNFNHRYMQLVSRVRNPNSLPAICHVDGSTRVQTVPKSNDPFRKLLEHWSKSTNCSVLLNTSLNIKGQPLISERKQAIQILMDNPIDAVAIGNRLYFKSEKMGLSDEPNDPVTIVEHVDFDNDETDPLHSKINRS